MTVDERAVWDNVIAGIVVIALAVLAFTAYYNRLFVAGGYCEQPRIGTSSTSWVKCEVMK